MTVDLCMTHAHVRLDDLGRDPDFTKNRVDRLAPLVFRFLFLSLLHLLSALRVLRHSKTSRDQIKQLDGGEGSVITLCDRLSRAADYLPVPLSSDPGGNCAAGENKTR